MVKFGIALPAMNVEYDIVRKIAIEGEGQKFDSVWQSDHLLAPRGPLQGSWLEAWTTLSALAEVTRRVRLGTLVLCNSFRLPSVLAKMAATLDVISNGRLELGMGAGWFKEEYSAYGIPFPKASVRITQLQEALEIIERIWTEEGASYQGEYYSTQNAYCNPKPIQKPHPPIWIGTMLGKKFMLETIAKYADGWMLPHFYAHPKEYKKTIEDLKLHCQEVGRDLENITKGLGVACVIAKNQRDLEDKVGRFNAPELSYGTKYVATQHRIEGTPEQCIESLKEYVNMGVEHFMLSFPDVITLEPLKLFGEYVIPAFR